MYMYLEKRTKEIFFVDNLMFGVQLADILTRSFTDLLISV